MKNAKRFVPALAAVGLAVACAAVLLGLRTPARDLTAAGGFVLKGPLVPARPATHFRAALAWCGTDAAGTDRTDAVSSDQVHVIYAIPSDGPDRFSTAAGGIAADTAAVDAWWRLQDPSRAPRWDLAAFPGCAPGLGQLDITRAQLAQPASYYAPTSGRFAKIVIELGDTFDDPFKKYLVFYDGAVEEPRLCGTSTTYGDRGGRYAYSVVYTQACRPDLGSGGVTASVAAHELGHNLGAVPAPGPPHACPGDDAHICDNEADLMFPYTHGQGLSERTLDPEHDDYYGHAGGWWDLQDSAWLSHVNAPQFGLSVAFTGSTGTGTVTSLTPGIACPPACSIAWDQGSEVELTALPADGSRFVGWSGGCTADPCHVTMNAAESVVARFAAQVSLSVHVKSAAHTSGTVTSRPEGIACPPACDADFDQGTRVSLVATPGKSSAFAGWSGSCAGKAACAVSVSGQTAVTATFAQPTTLRPPAKAPRCKAGQRPTKAKPCRR